MIDTKLPSQPFSSFKDPHDPWLFEISWEVCNQIGGIYTVLKSKVAAMRSRWANNYFVVGPYNPNTVEIEFEEREADDPLRSALAKLKERGYPIYYGHWLLAEHPNALLIDYRAHMWSINTDRHYLMVDNGIGGEDEDSDLSEFIEFGFCLTELFRELCAVAPEKKIVAHFHEWMSAVALPRIVFHQLPIATVFTTHATLLGRYIAANNPNFYRDLAGLNPDWASRHYRIHSRYLMERAAAHSANVFTTISEITAEEADKALGRQADIILPNGLNIDRFSTFHEFQNYHRIFEERIHEFVMGHFFPSYRFDLDRVCYIFTSGRYEYTNKGFDIFIEALHRLSWRLRDLPNPPVVVAFIITKAPLVRMNFEVLKRHAMFEELRKLCMQVENGLGEKILNILGKGQMPSYEDLLSADLQHDLKKTIYEMRSDHFPPVVTHDVQNDQNDPILSHLKYRQLFNADWDPVKVVFHPDFLAANSPLFSLDYDQFVRGNHLGVFPSYYEPWGYTPAECLALAVPTVTTDLSGIGSFAMTNIPEGGNGAIKILKRSGTNNDELIQQLTDYLYYFVHLTRRERIELRAKAEKISDIFAWSTLSAFYHEAHNKALERQYGSLGKA
ncbi:MAG: glycogen synthase [SAR324 cluster bacterium]|uniref:Glycogen synthase n=1 Tax=SAR324 cluster bacterium TaxID=2024889 RepID=A0A7X9FP17_9DELT|nr:glycogen synthase [SAR324 cluster bacterium]